MAVRQDTQLAPSAGILVGRKAVGRALLLHVAHQASLAVLRWPPPASGGAPCARGRPIVRLAAFLREAGRASIGRWRCYAWPTCAGMFLWIYEASCRYLVRDRPTEIDLDFDNHAVLHRCNFGIAKRLPFVL